MSLDEETVIVSDIESRQWADISWDAEGRAYSTRFGDWYFGEKRAYDEAMDVFCAGLGLPNAWSNFAWNNFGDNSGDNSGDNLRDSTTDASVGSHPRSPQGSPYGLPYGSPAGSTFRLVELGFGAGVNFLQTERLWRAWHKREARSGKSLMLDYYGIELYPMRLQNLQRIHADLLRIYADPQGGDPQERDPQGMRANGGAGQLLELWKGLERNPRRTFFRWQLSSRLRLTLLLEDARRALARIADASVDGWYLDGFAINGNPAMWSEDVFRHIGRCTRARSLANGLADGLTDGLTAPQLASFSVARRVRDAATSCGFRVHKRATIMADKTATLPRKREVLQGFFSAKNPTQKILRAENNYD